MVFCWIITEGIAGTETQCVSVAQALGVSYEIKRIQLKQPWRSLSPYLGFECAHTFTPPLSPPYPELVICSGRKAIAAARYIRKKSQRKTCLVQIQDPRIFYDVFDLVALPAHDPGRGDNVFVTQGAPNRITPEALAKAKAQFEDVFAPLTGNKIAVLIGGSTKKATFTQNNAQHLAARLKTLHDQGHSLMITASRRTGAGNTELLKNTLAPLQNVFFWDGSGDNPYLGMLAQADTILVTADSVSMLSEAGTTGKPVYIIDMDVKSERLQRFHSHLIEAGVARWFDGSVERWDYTPLHDAKDVADKIKEILSLRTPPIPLNTT